MDSMKTLHLKKSLLNSLLIVCCWLIPAQAGWASTKDLHQNTSTKKTPKKAKKEKPSIMGRAKYSHQTLEEIHVLGKTELDHVTVKGKTKVHGKFKIENSQLNTLEVQGRANVTNTSIQGATSIQGRTEVANSQLDKLKVQGKLLIRESTVRGRLKAQGEFHAIHTTFEAPAHTMGRFEAQDAIFQQEVHLIGIMHAYQTSFANTITAVTQEIVLHDTTTQDVYIKDNKDGIKKWTKKYKFLSFLANKQDEPQVITLSGKTIIQGSITFENGKGIVVLGDEAQIKGEVIGGTIKRL